MARVLIVDDEPENIELLAQYLTKEGHNHQSASDGEGALHRLRAWKPHLILLDVNLPGGASGLDLIPKIRAASGSEYISVVLVSSDMTPEDVARGLEAGADDYLTKPFRAQELLSRVRNGLRFKEVQDSLRRANNRVEELSTTDQTTGLLNLQTLMRRGDEEIMKSTRFRKPVSMLLVNIDHFSGVNQDHGFGFGNYVLKETGRRIKECVRNLDLVAHVGADEYFILLVESDLAAAEFVAERIRDAVQATNYEADRKSVRVTACVGVAGINYEQGQQKMNELIHSASEALVSAKGNGPNRVEIYSFT